MSLFSVLSFHFLLFLQLFLPHHNPPTHLCSYFFPLIHSVFSLLVAPLLILHRFPISSISFSYILLLKPPLSHPLSFPHWFTFFSLSPHFLLTYSSFDFSNSELLLSLLFLLYSFFFPYLFLSDNSILGPIFT